MTPMSWACPSTLPSARTSSSTRSLGPLPSRRRTCRSASSSDGQKLRRRSASCRSPTAAASASPSSTPASRRRPTSRPRICRVLRLHARAAIATAPVGRLRPRHAHRRPDRRQRRAVQRQVRRRGARRAPDRPEGARRRARGYTSDVIAAIEFATANKAALGIDVINLSLGHPIYEPAATDPLVQAVEARRRAPASSSWSRPATSA